MISKTRAAERTTALDWLGPTALFVCTAATVALLVWVYQLLIATPWLPLWDESTYYPTAVRLLHFLRAWDLRSMARETMRYHLAGAYPILGPYFLALGMRIGGTTLEAARTTSLVAGLTGWAGVAWLAAEMSGRRKACAAAIAGALWGTSPMFLFYASRAYYESFSLMIAVYCFIAAARFAKSGSRPAALATGLLASMAFLTKVNVGALIMAALFLGLAWPEFRKRLVADPRGLLDRVTRPWVLLAAAAILPVAAWLMVSGLRQFARVLRGDPFNPLNLTDQFLFVPRALLRDYVSYPALGVLLLAGLAYWAFKGWTEPGVRIAWIYAALNLVSEMLHTTKDSRFIWGAVGVAAALTGTCLVRVVPQWPRWARVPAAALLVLAMLGSFWAAPAAAQRFVDQASAAPAQPQQKLVFQALEFIRQNIGSSHPVLMAGESDLGIQHGMLRQFLMDATTGQEPDVQTLPYPGFPATWGNSPQPSPLYAQLLTAQLVKNPDAVVVILDHQPGAGLRGRLYPWVLSWQENYARAAAESKELQVAASLDTGKGLKVIMYRRCAERCAQ